MGTHRGLRETERHKHLTQATPTLKIKTTPNPAPTGVDITPTPAGKPMPEPANEGTGNQDLSVTQHTQDAQTTEQTHETRNTNPTQEFLALLGIPSKQSGGDASVSGGFSVGGTDVGVVATPTASTPAEVLVGAREARSPDQQLNKTAETTAQRSRVVDCRPCGGCCGNRAGVRVPAPLYDLLLRVAEREGVPVCRLFTGDLCGLISRLRFRRRGRGHGLGGVKERERLLSREAQYKGSYLVKRLRECGSDVVCAEYVRLGVEGWLRFWFHYRGRALGDGVVESYLGRIAKSLGFNGIIGLARYLKAVVQGLIIEYPTDRHAGYKDVLEVGCGLCGVSFGTTVELPAFIVKLVRHFQVVHGLRSVEDVEARVEELVIRELDRKDKPRVHPALRELVTEKLVNTFANILVAVGLLEEADGGGFRCVLDGVVVDGAPEAVVHVLERHHDVIRDVKHLLEVRGGYGGEGAE